MEQKFLTILTPTYNRSEKLVDLYESLKKEKKTIKKPK